MESNNNASRSIAAVQADLASLKNLDQRVDSLQAVVEGLLEKRPGDGLLENLQDARSQLISARHIIPDLWNRLCFIKENPFMLQNTQHIRQTGDDVREMERIVAECKEIILQSIDILCPDALKKDKVSLKDIEDGKATCCVCQDGMPEATAVKRCPRCRQCYHNNCISPWVEEKYMCPHCKIIIKVGRYPNVLRAIRLLRRRPRRFENV